MNIIIYTIKFPAYYSKGVFQLFLIKRFYLYFKMKNFYLKNQLLRFSSGVLLLLATDLWAGAYTITPENYLNSGLTFSLDTTQLLTNTSSSQSYFYVASTTNNQLEITGLSLKEGFTWQAVNISIISGSATLNIKDSTGTTILNSTTISSTQSINISQTESAKRGRALIFSITFNSTSTQLASLSVSFNGGGVYLYPSPYNISNGRASISYDLGNDAIVSLKIFDNRGRLVKTIYDNQSISAKSTLKQLESWDGRNDRGNKVASGVYTLYIEVKFLSTTNGTSSDYNNTFRFVVLS